MKIRQQSDGQWRLDLRWPDNIRSRYFRRSMQEISDLETRIRASILEKTWEVLRQSLAAATSPLAPVKFSKLADLYVEEYVKVYNRGTAQTENRIERLKDRFGSLPASSINSEAVMKYVSTRQGKVKNRTINREISILRKMMAWAKAKRYLAADRLVELEALSEQQWDGPRPTEDILDAVFVHLRADVLPLFTFLRETGCRREEALSLRSHQVDLESREVYFAGNTKSGKSRRVPLTEKAVWAVEAMPESPRTDYVFYSSDGETRWYNCRKPWEDARSKAGYRWLRIQDLRRAYGIRLAESGECTMHDIQAMLGHSSVIVTEKFYAQFMPQAARPRVLRGLEGGRKGQQKGSEKKMESAG